MLLGNLYQHNQHSCLACFNNTAKAIVKAVANCIFIHDKPIFHVESNEFEKKNTIQDSQNIQAYNFKNSTRQTNKPNYVSDEINEDLDINTKTSKNIKYSHKNNLVENTSLNCNLENSIESNLINCEKSELKMKNSTKKKNNLL